ncbi:hypothetical protein U1Q18_038604 [Sarracenia purpurea var. burkii]
MEARRSGGAVEQWSGDGDTAQVKQRSGGSVEQWTGGGTGTHRSGAGASCAGDGGGGEQVLARCASCGAWVELTTASRQRRWCEGVASFVTGGKPEPKQRLKEEETSVAKMSDPKYAYPAQECCQTPPVMAPPRYENAPPHPPSPRRKYNFLSRCLLEWCCNCLTKEECCSCLMECCNCLMEEECCSCLMEEECCSCLMEEECCCDSSS